MARNDKSNNIFRCICRCIFITFINDSKLLTFEAKELREKYSSDGNYFYYFMHNRNTVWNSISDFKPLWVLRNLTLSNTFIYMKSLLVPNLYISINDMWYDFRSQFLSSLLHLNFVMWVIFHEWKHCTRSNFCKSTPSTYFPLIADHIDWKWQVFSFQISTNFI